MAGILFLHNQPIASGAPPSALFPVYIWIISPSGTWLKRIIIFTALQKHAPFTWSFSSNTAQWHSSRAKDCRGSSSFLTRVHTNKTRQAYNKSTGPPSVRVKVKHVILSLSLWCNKRETPQTRGPFYRSRQRGRGAGSSARRKMKVRGDSQPLLHTHPRPLKKRKVLSAVPWIWRCGSA